MARSHEGACTFGKPKLEGEIDQPTQKIYEYRAYCTKGCGASQHSTQTVKKPQQPKNKY